MIDTDAALHPATFILPQPLLKVRRDDGRGSERRNGGGFGAGCSRDEGAE